MNIQIHGNFCEVYAPAKEVFCDTRREKRCKDRKKCYPVSQHCDFIVDCEDNSDEEMKDENGVNT